MLNTPFGINGLGSDLTSGRFMLHHLVPIEGPLKPLEYHSTMLPKGFRGSLIMARTVSLSDSPGEFFKYLKHILEYLFIFKYLFTLKYLSIYLNINIYLREPCPNKDI